MSSRKAVVASYNALSRARRLTVKSSQPLIEFHLFWNMESLFLKVAPRKSVSPNALPLLMGNDIWTATILIRIGSRKNIRAYADREGNQITIRLPQEVEPGKNIVITFKKKW